MQDMKQGIVAVALAAGSALGAFAKHEIYVAADAAAGGTAGSARPIRRWAQARDGLRAARQSGAVKSGRGGHGLCGSGVLSASDATFELKEEDGGTAGAPVIYRALKRARRGYTAAIRSTPPHYAADGRARVARLDPRPAARFSL
jgi:hypothetical protein